MEPTGGDLSRHDHEFDEVRWIDFDEAPPILTFETERALVAHAADVLAGAVTGDRPAGPRRGRLVTEPVEVRGPHETPLADRHEALGARMIDFAGWRMPVQYSSILDEHRAVRERVGLFDLSHMGELLVEGPEAAAALAPAVVSDPQSRWPWGAPSTR